VTASHRKIAAGGERRTGRFEQVLAQRAEQVLSRGHGRRHAFTGGIDRLVGDAGQHLPASWFR
jgi:hypothetical protein